jgi:hypothetical protein
MVRPGHVLHATVPTLVYKYSSIHISSVQYLGTYRIVQRRTIGTYIGSLLEEESRGCGAYPAAM